MNIALGQLTFFAHNMARFRLSRAHTEALIGKYCALFGMTKEQVNVRVAASAPRAAAAHGRRAAADDPHGCRRALLVAVTCTAAPLSRCTAARPLRRCRA